MSTGYTSVPNANALSSPHGVPPPLSSNMNESTYIRDHGDSDFPHELVPLEPLCSPGSEKPQHTSGRPSSMVNTADLSLTRHSTTFTSSIIITSVALGALLVIAQHLLNSTLDQTEVSQAKISQAWASHLNTGLAYAAKTAFGICIGFSLQQVFWHTVRNRLIPMGVLDYATTITSNPLPVLHFKMYRHCFAVAVIGIISCCVPLASVFSPGSLEVARQPVWSSQGCDVPGLSLSKTGEVYGGPDDLPISPWFNIDWSDATST